MIALQSTTYNWVEKVQDFSSKNVKGYTIILGFYSELWLSHFYLTIIIEEEGG